MSDLITGVAFFCECGHEDEDHGADRCNFCACQWFQASDVAPEEEGFVR